MMARKSSNTRIDGLLESIGALVAERQALRERNALAADLERNRQEIADLQQQLSKALIERYLPKRDPEERAA
jgi:hypothetical protein